MILHNINDEEIKNRRTIIIFLVVGTFLIISFSALMHLHENAIKQIDISDYNIDNKDIRCVLDNSFYKKEINGDSELCISGWCVMNGVSIERVNMHVIVNSERDHKYYILPTYMQKREDVTAFMNDGCNYDNSGFGVNITNANKFDYENDKLDIFLLYEINGTKGLLSLNKSVEEKKNDDTTN